MILREVPGVVLPRTSVITLSGWPTLLQHLYSIIATTSKLGDLHLSSSSSSVWAFSRGWCLSVLKSGIDRPTLDFLIQPRGHHSGPISMHGELFWQPEHGILKVFSMKRLLLYGRGSSGEEDRGKKRASMLKVAGFWCSVESLAGFQCPVWCCVIDKLRII